MEARKLEEIEDGLLFDPNTGEVIGADDVVLTTSNAGEIRATALPKLARALRSIQRQVDRLAEYQTAEVERIRSITQHRIDALTSQRDYILKVAESMFGTLGEKKIEYPGLGSFRRVKGRESVNSDEYDAMPDEMKKAVQSAWSNYFTTKTVVSPNKKDILVGLKEGAPIEGFIVNEAGEKFEFKGE